MSVAARFLVVVMLCLVMLGLGRLAGHLSASNAGSVGSVDYGTAPSFALLDEHGERFSSAQLEGKVYVAAFFFSSCRGPCPIINANMARLHEQFAESPSLEIISISVDPETDTPEVLAEVAKKFAADGRDNWSFLTGTQREINDVVTKGFKVALTGSPPIHTNRVALIDRDSRIIGFYDGTSAEDVERLAQRIAELLAS